MPSPSAPLEGVIRRRDVLAGALAIAALALTASACSSDTPPEVDVLVAQLDLATGDHAMALAAATAAAPPVARALSQIASERAAHADALSAEIARVAGQPSPTSTTTSSTPASGAPVPPPSVDDVRDALSRSAESATKLVASLSGYRAGLLGSIAASCAASATVSLAQAPS
ncbi:MAG: hypothetical protein HYZ38_22400 [Mycobacterium sp.]|nr:hypothetical protein [Mycobacterium sp.]